MAGNSLMLGYWEEPGLTAEAIDAEGWMHTGDLATMDEDDNRRIFGRIKDMVIRGGENPYPREVEEFLYVHSDVAEVQIVSVPDRRFARSYGLGADTRWCLAYRGGPPRALPRETRYVLIVQQFPMTITGKVPEVQNARGVDQEVRSRSPLGGITAGSSTV